MITMSAPLSALLALALAALGPASPAAETVEPGDGEQEPDPEPPPERLRWRGTGALVVGALAGAAGLALGVGTARQFAELEVCADCRERSAILPFATIALNTAAFSLIAAGAGLRGRDEGLQFAMEGLPRRAYPAAIGLGALFLGGGGLLVAGALTWRLLDEPRGSATPWAVLQAGMSMIVVGSGLVVYGSTYKKFAGPRLGALRLAPSVQPHHAGLALTGAF